MVEPTQLEKNAHQHGFIFPNFGDLGFAIRSPSWFRFPKKMGDPNGWLVSHFSHSPKNTILQQLKKEMAQSRVPIYWWYVGPLLNSHVCICAIYLELTLYLSVCHHGHLWIFQTLQNVVRANIPQHAEKTPIHSASFCGYPEESKDHILKPRGRRSYFTPVKPYQSQQLYSLR